MADYDAISDHVDRVAPSFIGKDGRESLPELERAFDGLGVVLLDHDMMTTAVFDPGRVKVWLDENGHIAAINHG